MQKNVNKKQSLVYVEKLAEETKRLQSKSIEVERGLIWAADTNIVLIFPKGTVATMDTIKTYKELETKRGWKHRLMIPHAEERLQMWASQLSSMVNRICMKKENRPFQSAWNIIAFWKLENHKYWCPKRLDSGMEYRLVVGCIPYINKALWLSPAGKQLTRITA